MTGNLAKLIQTRCFLLDMDGTFYLGDQLLPGAERFLEWMEERGTEFLFLTNNSSRNRSQYASKLNRLGLAVEEERIFTSGEATAIYLNKMKPGARLYVVGTQALCDELVQHGFSLDDEDIDLVVLGFDTTLTYEKLVKLCHFVREGKTYIATHPDINCPTEDGFIPDIGSFIALVEASTGRVPDVIVGKPHQPIVDAIVEKTGYPVEQLTMVGDRLYTDIALGKSGMSTVLVLSGETKKEDLAGSPFQPDHVMQDLSVLLQTLQES